MNPKNDVWEFLELLEISIKGLQFAVEKSSNDADLITNFVKKEIYDCINRNYDLNIPRTFFSETVSYDLNILHDYYGDNIDTIMRFETEEGEKYDIDITKSEEPQHYECYMNMIEQNQMKKYGRDRYPYIHLLQHEQFSDFVLDHALYQRLFRNAAYQLKEEDDPISLQEFEDKINQLYNRCHNIQLKPQHNYTIKSWRKELLCNLRNIKNKCKKMNANGKDLKLFLFLITLITQQADIDLSKGTIFSHFLANVLNQNKETIDDYMKRINQNDLSAFWNNYELQVSRLLETDSLLCQLLIDTSILQTMRKKIAKILPPTTEQIVKSWQDKGKINQYRELKELSIKKISTKRG